MAQVNHQALDEMITMGLDPDLCRQALAACQNDKERAIDWMFTSNSGAVPTAQPSIGQQTGFISREDELLNEAIEKSLQETKASDALGSFEPLNPEERIRDGGTYVGLKNVGNTCYVNSLIQTYFSIPEFTREVLTCKALGEADNQDNENPRRTASVRLVLQLQRLFASMIGSQSKYVDPSAVLNALVDDFGNHVIIGEQQDVGEFNINFIARAEEGLLAARQVEEPSSPDTHLIESIKREGSLTRSSTLTTMQQLLQSGDSFVARLFYGKQVEVLRAAEADSSSVEMRNEVAFGQIELNVDQKELYAAWDESYFCTINDYITSKGHVTQATQEVWLQRLPAVMLFQISRVKFDLKSGTSVKDHSAFSFPRVLYPDRYIESKSSLSAGLRAQVYRLKESVSALTARIDHFERYCADKVALHEMLQATAHFLAKQGEHRPQPVNPECPLYDVDCLDDLSQDHIEKFNLASRIVEEAALSAKAKLETMKGQLKQLREQIEAKFDIDDLKGCPYYLHSILIHEGQAGSGHYFAYIRDAAQNKWRKFNDIRVTEVDEQEVFRVATGGFGYNSAYCLVYVDDAIQQSLQNPALLMSYASTFPDHIQRELEESNAKLTRELVDWRLGRLMKTLQDIYTSRAVLAQAQHQSHMSQMSSRNETVKFELVNFTVYLRVKNFEYLSRWHLLDICVREITETHLGLEQMPANDPFYAKIKTQLHSACREAPGKLELSPLERTNLGKQFDDFFNNYREASIAAYVFRKVTTGEFIPAIIVFTMHLNSSDPTTPYRRIIVDSSKVLALRLCSHVMQMFYSGRADQVRDK
jgi:ubiquitin carboxyl-terminal hydrolase 25/28